MKTALLLFPAMFLVCIGSFGQSADNLVLQGRGFLTAKDITNANKRFAAAVATSPNHQMANALYAVSRILSLPYAQPALGHDGSPGGGLDQPQHL